MKFCFIDPQEEYELIKEMYKEYGIYESDFVNPAENDCEICINNGFKIADSGKGEVKSILSYLNEL